MKKLAVIFGVICVFAASAFAVSTKVDGKTIESCGALLPAGHTFTINLSGTIDTNSAERELKVNLSLSDGTSDENTKTKTAVKPFLNCVAPLVKSGVQPL